MIYPELSDCEIGFIGAGNISDAIANGFINSGQISAKQLSFSAPSNRNLNKFKELGSFTTNINDLIFSQTKSQSSNKSAKILFLCVKPHIFKSLDKNSFIKCEDLVSNYGPIIVISVMAGIEIKTVRNACYSSSSSSIDDKIRFARIMPNTACVLNSGICGISRDIIDPQFDEFLTSFLSLLGLCEIVPESQLNAICGLGGSGIAFVYSMIHAMSDGALKMGLPRNISTNFAAQTVLGAALMVLKTKKNPIELRDAVTSPAGTTIHGLHALEKGAFNASIIDAIESATKRANELS